MPNTLLTIIVKAAVVVVRRSTMKEEDANSQCVRLKNTVKQKRNKNRRPTSSLPMTQLVALPPDAECVVNYHRHCRSSSR